MTDGREILRSEPLRSELPRFELLGEVRALRGGVPVDLGPAKQRAVLAVLLLQAGRPVPTHQIVDAVWGDEPPENGANVVQKYVAGLRRALDPDRAPRTPGELVALTGGGYVLRTAGCEIDAAEFDAAVARAATARAAGDLATAADTLRAGLALWRGEALAGLGGPVFDAARQRLADSRATAWEKWAEVGLARGEATRLIPDLARLVEEFPLREGLRAQLMIALHQGGRQAEALAVFRDAREFFLDEVGAEPGERMQEVHRKILRGEPFYAEPVDPWAGGAEPGAPALLVDTAPPSQITPSPVTASPVTPSPVTPSPVTPIPAQPSGPPFSTSAPPGGAPFATPSGGAPFATPSGGPRMPPPGVTPPILLTPVPNRSFFVVELLLAVLLPVLTCGSGGWIYFVVLGTRRRDYRQLIVAGGYLLAFLAICFVTFVADPTSLETDEFSTAENVGFTFLFSLPVVAALHGLVVAFRNSHADRDRAVRDRARQFAHYAPDQARTLGIGRPDLLRGFDDGGLIDLNHLGGYELAWAGGLPMEQAHRIVSDRAQRGPFQRPEDLLIRGLATRRTVRRLAPRLICIPPAPPY